MSSKNLHTEQKYIVIGKKLRFFREEAGLSQNKFAELINISPKTLYTYEKTGIIPTDKLFEIAEFFNKNPMIFLSEDSSNYIREPGKDLQIALV